MSSFIGHGLAALFVGKAFEEKAPFKQNILWQGCLILCAFAPDIDYLIPSLNSINNDGLRITHSIAFSLILPTVVTLFFLFLERKKMLWMWVQACLAGVSHLFLDLMVGGRKGDPLLYPFAENSVNLPFGILPSAGAMNLSNYYFYRNLLIEMGILVPVFALVLVFVNKLKPNKYAIAGSVLSLTIFLIWSTNLTR